jgi:hypothetical protein
MKFQDEERIQRKQQKYNKAIYLIKQLFTWTSHLYL